MKNTTFPRFAIFALLISGCVETKIINSPEMTEIATVVDIVYTPSNHGSSVDPTFTLDGDVGITFTSVDIPERYAVVFECEKHKIKFIIQKDQIKTKELWGRLKQGQRVTVKYRDVYEEVRDDGKLIERRLKKYNFLDAY